MSHREATRKPTKMFRFYTVNLIVRTLLLVAAVLAAIFAPEQLSIVDGFGFGHGITLIDIIFVLLIADGLTKLFPTARIAIGSLKQFGRYHVPTSRLLITDTEQLRGALRRLLAQQKATIESLPASIRAHWAETRAGAIDSLKVLLSNFTFLKKLPLAIDRLKAEDPERARIKADRFREILPVIIFWVLFNGAVALGLWLFGVLTEEVLIIWMLIFFLFDMICVVLWCPLQLLFMKNRCCTTCQIFNWDAIMTVTPLFFMIGSLPAAPFTWPLIGLALVILLRWELAFARHPERFDERTNAALSCANCPDQLCYIREPLKARLHPGEAMGLKNSSAELDRLVTTLVKNAPTSPETSLNAQGPLP